MKILITGASSRLARAIATELDRDHELRLMDSVQVDPDGNAEFFQGSILESDDAQRAVNGIEALIHIGEPPSDIPRQGHGRDQALLDLATRGTHVLFQAGIEAGVKRFIYAGSLSVFSNYPDDVYISEAWKPLPTPEITQMTRYLGELICREFARCNMITVTSLRLGKLVLEEETGGHPPDPMWLDFRDAAQAFRCALNRDHSGDVWWARRWAVYHICAKIPHPKYLIRQAEGMGYKPRHNFVRTKEDA